VLLVDFALDRLVLQVVQAVVSFVDAYLSHHLAMNSVKLGFLTALVVSKGQCASRMKLVLSCLAFSFFF